MGHLLTSKLEKTCSLLPLIRLALTGEPPSPEEKAMALPVNPVHSPKKVKEMLYNWQHLWYNTGAGSGQLIFCALGSVAGENPAGISPAPTWPLGKFEKRWKSQ